MAQTEKKEKNYTDKELKKALKEQKDAIKQRIKLRNSDSLHKELVLREIDSV